MEKDVKFLKNQLLFVIGMWSEEIQNIRKEQSERIKEIERELSLCKEKLFTDKTNIVRRLRPRKQQNM